MDAGSTITVNSGPCRHNLPTCQAMTTLALSHFRKYTQGGLTGFGISWEPSAKTTIKFLESTMIHRKMDDRELVHSSWSAVPKVLISST
jgi:hypothetical protein